ncbi:LysR family transcriptional regulator [Aliiroseovarius subalbicans]|uniref:LysR family transcriptional regulator n=1 Tax=Aliiroseovarius subalbicans TaxID=2925840 RepID=UPI001F56AC05|nr:LysR family transcriptional regulator [Aliiroseovarius subalbicans]MCI2400695.1 LysR family transcriptional regulator [Aliiroseovarius subalbicans]
MEHWDEVRTAFQVAKHGTVSGAAAALGVHHATVIRHIDALEARLGVKLFQRHARGYTPTEAGADLARVGQATDDQLAQLDARIKGQGEGVTGDLVVTSLASFARLLVPVLADFQLANPGLTLRFLTGQRLFRLEYGEAHVAVRAGSAPEEPDNVAQKLHAVDMALYAAPSYVARRGMPTEATLTQHDFVGQVEDRSRAPFMLWMAERVPAKCITFRATDDRSLAEAVRAGIALGWMPVDAAEGLVQVLPPRPDWVAQLWLVTHVDLHRTAKVQACLAHLKQAAKTWG